MARLPIRVLVSILAAVANGAAAAVLHVDPDVPDVLATDGLCSLREAVINTNDDAATWPDCPAGTGADEIRVSEGTFTALESWEIRIGDELTLVGAGADRTVLDLGHLFEFSQLEVRVVGVSILGSVTSWSGPLVLEHCVVSGSSTNGVGIVFGALVVDSCTIASNALDGIAAYNAGLLVVNSTVHGNGGAGVYSLWVPGGRGGPGAAVERGAVVGPSGVFFSTVTGNGRGVRAGGRASSLPVLGSIVAQQTGSDCSGSGDFSLGYTLDSDGSCSADPTDLPGTDPMLGPLGSHGGPTETRVPALGSPAIDAVPVEDCAWDLMPLLYDQRRLARPEGSACDIGAVEVPEPAPALLLLTGALVLLGAGPGIRRLKPGGPVAARGVP